MRAVRMAARFDFPIEEQTAAAVREMAPEITVVSAERIADELRKMLAHRNRSWAMRQMDELGLLRHVLPEVEAEMKGLPQGPPTAPTGDLWQHTLAVLDVLDGPRWPEPAPVSFPLAFAALLHDVGKKRAAVREADRYTFHGHEHMGKRLAGIAGRRLKLSNAECDRVEWLVEKHQYLCDAPTMRASRLKPILVHPGIGELLALHRADSAASDRSTEHVEFCERMLRENTREELDPPPVLTGNDLLALGWKQGPLFKKVLDAVREAQLEGKARTKDEAVRLAEQQKKS
jgi:poly(A) polymerase